MADLSGKSLTRLASKPVRTCYTMHDCCLCPVIIVSGRKYHDGGYGKRAHIECVQSALETIRLKKELSDEEGGPVMDTPGYAYTHWDCAACGEPHEAEGDISSEVRVCDACGEKNRISHVN